MLAVSRRGWPEIAHTGSVGCRKLSDGRVTLCAMSPLTPIPGPVGLTCPACGEPPIWVFGGTQAWCQTDDCPILTWNPTMTLAELNAQAKVVDLRAEGGEAAR
jgi:hypothetical protein